MTLHFQTANPIIDKLDPYQFFIQYRLFRDATRSVNGTPVKDLTYLNRDLSKVVLLDAHPEHASAQPENSIILPKWEGDAKDRGLVAMIPFLECKSLRLCVFLDMTTHTNEMILNRALTVLTIHSHCDLQASRCSANY